MRWLTVLKFSTAVSSKMSLSFLRSFSRQSLYLGTSLTWVLATRNTIASTSILVDLSWIFWRRTWDVILRRPEMVCRPLCWVCCVLNLKTEPRHKSRQCHCSSRFRWVGSARFGTRMKTKKMRKLYTRSWFRVTNNPLPSSWMDWMPRRDQLEWNQYYHWVIWYTGSLAWSRTRDPVPTKSHLASFFALQFSCLLACHHAKMTALQQSFIPGLTLINGHSASTPSFGPVFGADAESRRASQTWSIVRLVLVLALSKPRLFCVNGAMTAMTICMCNWKFLYLNARNCCNICGKGLVLRPLRSKEDCVSTATQLFRTCRRRNGCFSTSTKENWDAASRFGRNSSFILRQSRRFLRTVNVQLCRNMNCGNYSTVNSCSRREANNVVRDLLAYLEWPAWFVDSLHCYAEITRPFPFLWQWTCSKHTMLPMLKRISLRSRTKIGWCWATMIALAEPWVGLRAKAALLTAPAVARTKVLLSPSANTTEFRNVLARCLFSQMLFPLRVPMSELFGATFSSLEFSKKACILFLSLEPTSV